MAADKRPEHLKQPGQQAMQGERRFEEIRQRIIVATSELLDWCEADQITASIIQVKAGVTRTTFIKHFSSAQEAIDATYPPN